MVDARPWLSKENIWKIVQENSISCDGAWYVYQHRSASRFVRYSSPIHPTYRSKGIPVGANSLGRKVGSHRRFVQPVQPHGGHGNHGGHSGKCGKSLLSRNDHEIRSWKMQMSTYSAMYNIAKSLLGWAFMELLIYSSQCLKTLAPYKRVEILRLCNYFIFYKRNFVTDL